ncbi:hypothetical protein ACVC7V_17385 [Hydrogenophaga sp. A37]|uniref:hypothetical protein n=1 Tax=Hydrogenophaga sp. A37 TaxID=1945864 RepID=UPI0009872F3A|nr:hypothetical protein [Hydrogenophaga sp. A37]OOG79191.1 hypothetical protein B0E41_25555 [Hydrogenophaga sp. A37]
MKTSDTNYSSAFYGGFSEDELALWRHLRNQGGYWIAGELMPSFPQLAPAQKVGGVLKRLFSAKHVARRMGAGGVWAYGVTAACSPPMRESMTIPAATLTEAA